MGPYKMISVLANGYKLTIIGKHKLFVELVGEGLPWLCTIRTMCIY